MSLRRCCTAVVLTALAFMAPFGGTAAAATGAVPVTDLTVTGGSATAKVGQQVFIWVNHINHGPGATRTGGVYWDYIAPPGTELIGESYNLTPNTPGPFTSGYCHWITPKTHMRCYSQLVFGDLAGVPMTYPPWHLWLKIDKPVTGTGRISIHCVTEMCTDPNPTNNTATLVIHMRPAATATKPPRTQPAATPTGSASPTPPAAPSPTDPPPQPTDPATTPASPLALAAQTGGVPWPLLAGTTVALLAGAGIVLILLHRRGRTS